MPHSLDAQSTRSLSGRITPPRQVQSPRISLLARPISVRSRCGRRCICWTTRPFQSFNAPCISRCGAPLCIHRTNVCSLNPIRRNCLANWREHPSAHPSFQHIHSRCTNCTHTLHMFAELPQTCMCTPKNHTPNTPAESINSNQHNVYTFGTLHCGDAYSIWAYTTYRCARRRRLLCTRFCFVSRHALICSQIPRHAAHNQINSALMVRVWRLLSSTHQTRASTRTHTLTYTPRRVRMIVWINRKTGQEFTGHHATMPAFWKRSVLDPKERQGLRLVNLQRNFVVLKLTKISSIGQKCTLVSSDQKQYFEYYLWKNTHLWIVFCNVYDNNRYELETSKSSKECV